MRVLNTILLLFVAFCSYASAQDWTTARDGYKYAEIAERTLGARRAKTTKDVYGASCRVNVQNARGSGTIIGCDDDAGVYLVLTNYHVVTTSKTAKLEFWPRGRRLETTGRVVWRCHDQKKPADYALVAIDRDFVEKNDLCFVPLAGPDVDAIPGAAFDSAGCPKGSRVWSSFGEVVSSNRTIEFVPAPFPGQSGSGIVAYIDDEPWYVGTLTWLVGTEGSDSARGAYIPISVLWEAWETGRTTTANEDDFVAPPNYSEVENERGEK